MSDNACVKHHEIQHLLIALDQLGKNFGQNTDTYYTLGIYLGYTDISLLKIESQKDPLSWILGVTAVKTSPTDIPDFISTLEQYFIKYGLWGFSKILLLIMAFLLC